jgi:putative hydrolase of the HAD superfamily
MTPAGGTLEAVVFDFDGLIIDTEWVIFETASSAFAAHGHELSIEHWATIVGVNDEGDGWYDALCRTAGIDLELALFEEAYAAQDRSNRDELEPLPGVVELIEALARAGVPLGVASSSSSGWLDRHLPRLGLRDHFATVVGSDLVGGVGKPAPDVYLKACADLGAAPTGAIAIEDSAHGVSAAKAAGMHAVAVPGRITVHNDFSRADLVVASLADVTVDDLISLVE